jgi:hypothetical protein
MVYTHLPAQLERFLIEVIPDLICTRPYIKIDGELLSTAKTMSLMASVRDALCYARKTGNAYLYVDTDGSVRINSRDFFKSKDFNLFPDVIVAFNASYDSSEVLTTYTGSEEDRNMTPSARNPKAIYAYRTWKQGSPLITEDVCAAYSLFRNAQDRAFLRLKNGNGTLLSLIEGEDEEEQITPEIIRDLDTRYDMQNRMYAPEGSKLTGISVSLDGIQAVLDTFWENIFRAAVIPPWAYEKQQLNSSFTIEHMIKEKERLFFKEVYPVLMDILAVFVPRSKVSIESPDYAPEKYRQEVNLLKADVKVRNADVKVKLKSTEVSDFEMKMEEKQMKLGQQKPQTLATPLVSPEPKPKKKISK